MISQLDAFYPLLCQFSSCGKIPFSDCKIHSCEGVDCFVIVEPRSLLIQDEVIVIVSIKEMIRERVLLFYPFIFLITYRKILNLLTEIEHFCY